MKKIFCLFSIENNYDQPDNNLIAWWSEAPSEDQLIKVLIREYAIGIGHTEAYYASIVAKLLKETLRLNNTDYRLEEVEESE